MQVQIITIDQLEAFIASDRYQKGEATPISPHRARAQALNPRAKGEDAALFVIYQDDRLLGYLGSIPDEIRVQDQTEKCAWLSCIWVSPTARGQGIAGQLLKAAYAHWQGKILMTEFTPEAREMYERSGLYQSWEGAKGVRGYIRPDFARILPPRGGIWPALRPLLRLTDALLQAPNQLRFLWHRYDTLPYTYLETMDEATERWIADLQTGEWMRRDRADFNWILQHPWVLKGAPTPNPYYFTSYAPDFQQFACKITRHNGEMAAFLWMTLRDRHLKIRYCYTRPEHVYHVVRIIYQHAVQHRVSMVTVQDERIAQSILSDKYGPFFYKKAYSQAFLMSKAIATKAPFRFQSGDGDAVFT